MVIAVLIATGGGGALFRMRQRHTATHAADAGTHAWADRPPPTGANVDAGDLLPQAAAVRDKAVAASRQAFATLERRWEQQARDDAWAGPEQDRLADSYRAAKLGTIAEWRDVDCHRTLCAVTIRYASPAHLDDDVATITRTWLMTLAPCTYHAPAPLMLDLPADGSGPEAKIFIECPR